MNIKIDNVIKRFDECKALDGLSLDIEENKIYGLVGRNGSGKTTLMKIIANQIFPTSGKVYIKDKDIAVDEGLMANICLSRELVSKSYGNMKVKDILYYARICYDKWDSTFENELINKFELNIKKKYEKLSKGMQTIVSIIIGLASRAPITMFDEPYVGLDPIARSMFYEILNSDYIDNPRTIIISTHLITELENIFERLIFINRGKLLLYDDVYDIKEKSYIIEGNENDVKEMTWGNNVIYKSNLGRLATYVIMDKINEEVIREMNLRKISVKRCDLHNLFIYLVKNEEGCKYEGNQ